MMCRRISKKSRQILPPVIRLRIVSFLNTVIAEAREETATEVAKVLKSQLDKIDSPKRESVMEKLAQAAEKTAPASPSQTQRA